MPPACSPSVYTARSVGKGSGVKGFAHGPDVKHMPELTPSLRTQPLPHAVQCRLAIVLDASRQVVTGVVKVELAVIAVAHCTPSRPGVKRSDTVTATEPQ